MRVLRIDADSILVALDDSTDSREIRCDDRYRATKVLVKLCRRRVYLIGLWMNSHQAYLRPAKYVTHASAIDPTKKLDMLPTR